MSRYCRIDHFHYYRDRDGYWSWEEPVYGDTEGLLTTENVIDQWRRSMAVNRTVLDGLTPPEINHMHYYPRWGHEQP